MFCTNCGFQIEKDDKFCKHCGVSVKSKIKGEKEEFTDTKKYPLGHESEAELNILHKEDKIEYDINTFINRLVLKTNTFTYIHKGIIKPEETNYKYEDITYTSCNYTHKYISGISQGAEVEICLLFDEIEPSSIKNILKSKSKPSISISKDTSYRQESPKLQYLLDANAFICNKSFHTRIKKYINSFKKNGCFEFNNVKYFIDGTIEVGKLRFNIKDISTDNIKIIENGFKICGIGKSFWNKDINFNPEWNTDLFYPMLYIIPEIKNKLLEFAEVLKNKHGH